MTRNTSPLDPQEDPMSYLFDNEYDRDAAWEARMDQQDAETEDERDERQNREDWIAAHTCTTCMVVEDERIIAPADDDACPDCGSIDPGDPVIVARVRARQAAAMLPHAVETLDALAAKIADLWIEARRQAGGYVSDVAGRGIVYPDDGAQREAYAIEWFRTQVGLVGNDLGSLADYLRPLIRG